MVGLDCCRRTFNRNRFNDIWVQSSLDKETDFAVGFPLLQIAGSFLEDGDEFPADALALFFGIGDAFELREKAVGGVDADDVKAKTLAVHRERVFEFVFSKEASIHEDVGEAIAHCFVNKHGGDRRVHTTA